jgi:butyryl-CoA dehydrogenase
MDFDLSEDHQLLRDSAREFAIKELSEKARWMDQHEEFDPSIVTKMAEIGFLGMCVPEKYGGTEMGNLAASIVLEEVARVCATSAVTLSVHNSLVSSLINKWASEELKAKYLPQLAAGEVLGAYALSEAGSGSDAAALVCEAEDKGDHYVLRGSKLWITQGISAKVVVVMARTDKTQKTRGITTFLLDKRTMPGINPGKKEAKLGIRGSETVELLMEDVKVPKNHVIGEVGQGFKIALDTLDGGRIGIASQALGITRACLEDSVKYSKERHAFGNPISSFQAIQWKLADMAAGLDAARLMTHRAAWLKDQGRPHSQEAAMAKLLASTLANESAREAVQIHGGMGYTTDMNVERYFRDARITEIYEGTTEIQRLVIARNLIR